MSPVVRPLAADHLPALRDAGELAARHVVAAALDRRLGYVPTGTHAEVRYRVGPAPRGDLAGETFDRQRPRPGCRSTSPCAWAAAGGAPR